jgi:MFS family permease
MQTAANKRCLAGRSNALPPSLRAQLLLPFTLIWHSRQLKAMLPAWVMIVGSLMTFQSLWAVSWYQAAFQADKARGSAWATLVGVGVIIGNFGGGQLSRLVSSRRKLIRIISAAYSLVWILEWLLLFSHWSLPAAGIGGLLVGFCGGTIYTQMTAGAHDVAPFRTIGMIFGVINCLIFLVVVILQSLSGVLIDAFSKTQPAAPNAYAYAFALILLLVILSLIALRRLEEFPAHQTVIKSPVSESLNHTNQSGDPI